MGGSGGARLLLEVPVNSQRTINSVTEGNQHAHIISDFSPLFRQAIIGSTSNRKPGRFAGEINPARWKESIFAFQGRGIGGSPPKKQLSARLASGCSFCNHRDAKNVSPARAN